MLSKLCGLSAAMAPFATLVGHVLALVGVHPAANAFFAAGCVLALIGEIGKWFGG